MSATATDINASGHQAQVSGYCDLATSQAVTGPKAFTKVAYAAATELTIASGVVTATQSAHRIDTEADAASDDLDTISGGTAEDILIIRPENTARTVVLKHGTGNIYCPGGQDIELADIEDCAILRLANSKWSVVAHMCLGSESARLRKASVTIAAAAVRTLNATPVTLVAAPGSGKFIEVESIHAWLDYGTAGYDAVAAGDDLAFKYSNASGAKIAGDIAGAGFGDQTTDQHRISQPLSDATPVANVPMVAHILVGEWYAAAGDSALKIEVLYRVRALEF